MEKFSIEKIQDGAEKMRDKIDSGETEACDKAEKEDTSMDLDMSVEKPSENIAVIRHFDDIDDLFNFGQDGDLIPGQEMKANLIAQEVYSEIKKDSMDAAMFICSNMKRATQTADLIVNQLREIDGQLKLRVVAENDLASIHQGEFILPADYKSGDSFVGLDLANKAFTKEVFTSDDHNYLYKFGDPVLQNDRSYKYPELVPYFKSYGENNSDFLLRIYNLVVRTHDKIEKFNSKTKAVIVTHSQLYQIFRDLNTIADMIKNEGLEIKTGELPELCWSLYSERFEREKPTYGINYISIESLCDSEVIELLKKEIEYLKNLK